MVSADMDSIPTLRLQAHIITYDIESTMLYELGIEPICTYVIY